MSHRMLRKVSAGRVITALLVSSVVLVILPGSITAPLRNIGQLFVPFQDMLGRLTRTAKDSLIGHEANAHQHLQRRVQALSSAVALLESQNRTLQEENEQLTRVRGRGLGPRGRLLPARVVADDAASWRESKLLLLRGAKRRDAVLSNYFSVELGEPSGAATGLGVLASEVLVGTIETVGTYTSRVRLLSDPATRMSVAVGRLTETEFTTIDAAFWLVGGGNGQLRIRDVHHQYVDDGDIMVGDIVLTRDDDPYLPPAVNIGRITEIRTDADNSLLYVLDVDPGFEFDDLRRVYVVDTGG